MKIALMLMTCAATAAGGQAAAQGPTLADAMLAGHNRERAQVGVPGLGWDPRLAAAAAAYARQLARLGRLEHATREARAGAGENLARGTQGFYSAAALAQGWAAEKAIFVNGIFPNVIRADARGAVGHYTQMVWRSTTSVGCGTASDGRDLYLVCRYSPPGNVLGRPVF
jgi:hypothetical protein